MHPLLAIGLLVVVMGVFADAIQGAPKTKVIKIQPKKNGEKPDDKNKNKPEGKPEGASDSEE